VNYVEGNLNVQKKNAGKKMKFFEATKNFKNPSNLSNSKKGKTCYNYGNKGHYKCECKFQKKQKQKDPSNVQNSNITNMVEHETKLVAMLSKLHIGMITELYMVVSIISINWWYDSGSTIHACNK
jgi:hypothetical protein